MSGVRILSRTSSKTKTGQYVLSFVLFESGSDSKGSVYTPFRSAQSRRPPDVLRPLSHVPKAIVEKRLPLFFCVYNEPSGQACLHVLVYLANVHHRAVKRDGLGTSRPTLVDNEFANFESFFAVGLQG